MDAVGCTHRHVHGRQPGRSAAGRGAPVDLLLDLASGGPLLDVGEARIDEGMLLHPGPLEAARARELRGHVGLGQEMLEGAPERARPRFPRKAVSLRAVARKYRPLLYFSGFAGPF